MAGIVPDFEKAEPFKWDQGKSPCHPPYAKGERGGFDGIDGIDRTDGTDEIPEASMFFYICGHCGEKLKISICPIQ